MSKGRLKDEHVGDIIEVILNIRFIQNSCRFKKDRTAVDENTKLIDVETIVNKNTKLNDDDKLIEACGVTFPSVFSD